jgi:putative transcriptional regulator
MLLDSYQGMLLVSQPKCQSSFFKEGVVLVANHNSTGAWGVVLNKALTEFGVSDLLDHIGIENQFGIDAPLYVGGPVQQGRVYIVHSAEWSGSSTIDVLPGISITNDISVLTAIAAGEGPEQYRVVTGISAWTAGQLDGEMRGQEPWTHRHKWLTVPANTTNVFEINGSDQWKWSLAQAVSLEVKELF